MGQESHSERNEEERRIQKPHEHWILHYAINGFVQNDKLLSIFFASFYEYDNSPIFQKFQEHKFMYNYETIEIIIDDQYKNKVAVVTLNRPDVRNALNNTIVAELYDIFEKLAGADEIRCIVLTGSGSSFCSGADLKWLKDIKSNSSRKNYNESLKLTKLLFLINNHPKPVIAKVNGPAVGGGVGLMLGCDIIVARDDLRFGLSEVAMGIVPAAIVPFVVSRIGETRARELLITGERVHAAEAVEMGLINYAVPSGRLDDFVDSKVDRILKNGPQAIQIVKEMIFKTQLYKSEELHNYIADVITELRKSEEAREGMDAFIEKRKPEWAEIVSRK